MKFPVRLVSFASAGLLLAACSSGSETDEAESTAGTDGATEAQTGGVCDVAVGEGTESTPVEADEAASLGALTAVTLSGAEADSPTVTFTAPLGISAEVAQLAADGDGETLEEGQFVTFDFLVCDIVTGEKVHSTWGTDGAEGTPSSYILSADNFGETLTEALVGAEVGSSVLWGLPGVSAEESYTGAATNGYLYVMTVADAETIPDSASGTEVTPSDESLPAISFESGVPEITVPDSFGEPAELVSQLLIEGDGDAVEAGQTVAVKYSGWLVDGTQFDSSWAYESPNDVAVFEIGVGGVIDGWDQGIVGQSVGSRVLLIVPSDMAYGADGYGDMIPADSTLIFVVDILGAY